MTAPSGKPPRRNGSSEPGWWKALECQQRTIEAQQQVIVGLTHRVAAVERVLAPAMTPSRPREHWAGPKQVSQATTTRAAEDPDHSPEAVAAIMAGDWQRLADIRQEAARKAASAQAAAQNVIMWRTRDGGVLTDGRQADPVQVSKIDTSVPELGSEPLPGVPAAAADTLPPFMAARMLTQGR